jgi:ferredoxin
MLAKLPRPAPPVRGLQLGDPMADRRAILVCSCEDTVPLDGDTLQRGCRGSRLISGRQFCRAELDRFRELVAGGTPITVGCTQEEPLFREIAASGDSDIAFVNLRENAGWSADAWNAGPKMAALAAAAAEPTPEASFVTLDSEGVILVYGRDERAIEAAGFLKDHLDVTVLITRPDQVAPPRAIDFPIVKGTIRSAKGHLGRFDIIVDDYAAPLPSSRGALAFGPPRDGATSRCDVLLDVSGGSSLFSAADLRDGYLRADPGNPAAVLEAVLRARDLVGSFDKPRYVAFTEQLCAHARSGIVGCRRCLDLCPTGAIAPNGDHVAIDASICAGCGQCAAACPTGAAGYALPPADALMRRLRTLLTVYREAGGRAPVLLFHDDDHGRDLIDALARHGEGLPSHVLPFAVNETTAVGLETVAAAFAYGAAAVRFVMRARARHDVSGLTGTIALAQPILAGLGLAGERVATIETDDPFALGDMLRAMTPGDVVPRPAGFQPVGPKRDVLRLALRELHHAARSPVDVVALPAGAPFGAVEIAAQGCTLCLACVSACPTGALSDDADRPMLRFAEEACVQCGLCRATCPEKVISLVPRIDFRAATTAARVLKEEEPFPCVRCGKPFGVKSTIERVVAKLAGRHWMYPDAASRLDVIRMCEDCRVAAVTEEGFDPHAPARAKVRTTDDYLREQNMKPPT